jgi:ribonucleoside-diphosphate reductase alpha chain
MKIERRFTKAGQSAYAEIEFRKATSEIKNPDGSIVFRLENIDVPAQFSQVAADILAQKYFRKAGVPAKLKRVEENDVPSFLWRSVPDAEALKALPKEEQYGSETDARQVFDRLAGTWTYWGWKGGYFDTEEDAAAFRDELAYMLATQRVAPNSPQWFNTGLHWAYGIDGPGQGHFYVDPFTGKLTKSKSAYEHPQPHACFIQSVADDLVNEGGIMDLWVREARLFKYGSGTGSNFSHLRAEGEKLSGGGKSSGLMSFLKIGDRAAGAIKSGGTTRRQDGRRRHRPSRHRGIHQLEGQGRAEGRRPRHRLEDRRQAPEGDHEGLRQLRRQRRRLLRSEAEPGAEARNPRCQTGAGSGKLRQARHPVRAPGLQGHRVQDL